MPHNYTICLLIPDLEIHYWQYRMIEDIIRIPHFDINCIVVTQKNSQKNAWLFKLYMAYERKAFKISPNALSKKDITEILSVPTFYTDHYGAVLDNAKLELEKVDFIVKIDFQLKDYSLGDFAKYGILYIYPTAIDEPVGNSPAIREVINNCDTVDVNLVYKSKHSKEEILTTSKLSIDKISVLRTVNNLLMYSSRILPRELEKIAEKSFSAYINSESNNLFFNSKSVPKWTLSKTRLVGSLCTKYILKIKSLVKKIKVFDQWILLYNIDEQESILKPDLTNYKKLIPPSDRFWADPFIYRKGKQFYVFFEELFYNDNKGHISVIELGDNGMGSTSEIVLKTNYHLSYPFLFEDNGALYMIPETSENKTIELYKCVEFPNKWIIDKVLFDNIIAVDTTLFKKDGKYWMFTNIKEREGTSKHNDLFLFYADSLLSDDWKPHPLNPVVTDITKARSAGNLFIEKNFIYRPAQDCGKFYGYGVTINKIIKLNEHEYEEQEIHKIVPNWDKNIFSTHTINKNERLTVIDGRLRKKK